MNLFCLKIYKLFLYLILIILIINCKIIAQNNETTSNQDIENVLEQIVEQNEENTDIDHLFEWLEFYKSNPLNINNCTQEDLEKFNVLTDKQIQNFINYREYYGKILSINELIAIYGFSEIDLNMLSPYFTIGEKPKVVDNEPIKWKYSKSKLLLRTNWNLENSKGYITDNQDSTSPKYPGNKYKYYCKYNYKIFNKLEFGFTSEKDAGEQFFKRNQKQGFDFYSAFFQVQNIKKIKKIIVGDFRFQGGQGLVCWPGLSFGKSTMVTNTNKRADGLCKYSSTDENNFFRGAGFTSQIKKLWFTGFYSYKKIDANLQNIERTGKEITSLQNSGYHRTKSENEDKDAVNESVTGMNLQYKAKNFETGLTALYSKYNLPFVKDNDLYTLYKLAGNSNTNIGLNYRSNIKGVFIFGEGAISLNGGKAIINGLTFSPAKLVSLVIMHRYYSVDYQAIYSNAFGENSNNQNEKGFYAGIEYAPVKYWKLTFYYDRFIFPWLRYRVNKPSEGYDCMFMADYHPNKVIKTYIKIRYNQKSLNEPSSENNEIAKTLIINKLNCRLNLDYSINKNITLRNRFEYSRYKSENQPFTSGFLIYQDVNIRSQKTPLRINMRYAIFDANDWNTAIYAYENDVRFNFAAPAYYKKGSRWYINLDYNPTDYLEFWLKFAQTSYLHTNKIGSGNDEIAGNKKSEIKLQMMLNF